jgi:hypothetical protein
MGTSGMNSGNEITLVQGDPGYVHGLSVDQWSMQSFMVESLAVDFGQVTGDLSLAKDTLVGTVRNESSHMLRDAVIILGRRFQRLGDLPAGREASVELAMSDLANPNLGVSLSYQIFEREFSNPGPNGPPREIEAKRIVLEGLLDRSSTFTIAAKMRGLGPGAQMPSYNTNSLLLLAWLDEAPPTVRITSGTGVVEEPGQQTTAVILIPLSYGLPQDGRISLPVGMIPGMLAEAPREGGACGDMTVPAVYIYRGEALFEFTLPVEMSTIQIENLKLSIITDTSWFTSPTIELYDWQANQWLALEGVQQGANLIPNAANLVSPNGLVRIRMTQDEANNQGGCYYLAMGLEGWPAEGALP